MYCYWKIGKRTQKEIGKLFQKTDSAVSHAIKRFENRMRKDRDLGRLIKETESEYSSFKL